MNTPFPSPGCRVMANDWPRGGPRRSTPPSPAKAVHHRLRQELTVMAWGAAQTASVAVPLAVAWVVWLGTH